MDIVPKRPYKAKLAAVKNGGEEYEYKVNSDKSQGRYYVHLNHLDDMIQKTKYDDTGETGYKERTESHRVRCVRKM